MAESERLRVGIIGGGFMGTTHSKAVRATGAELISVATSHPDRAREAAAALGAHRTVGSAEELIADAEIDVVHVCTPNASHERLAQLALDAGKHVVCEKPLTTDADSAERLASRAAAAGVVATVPFVYRFHPMVREARARVRSGRTGRLLHLDGRYLQDWMLTPDDQNWRVDAAVGGRSRAFADIGSHLVDLVEFVTDDRVAALHATTTVAHPIRGGQTVSTEDAVHLLVRMSSGCHGALTVSQVAAGAKNALRLELFGTEASIAFDQERPDSLVIGSRSQSSVIAREATELNPDAARLSVVPAGHPMGYQDAFTAFVRDSYDGIAGDLRPEVPTFADGARAALITDAVLESAGSATWTELPVYRETLAV